MKILFWQTFYYRAAIILEAKGIYCRARERVEGVASSTNVDLIRHE